MEMPKPKNVAHIAETIRHEYHYIAGDGFVVPRPQCPPLLGKTCPRLSQFYIRLLNGRSSTDAMYPNQARMCNAVCNS